MSNGLCVRSSSGKDPGKKKEESRSREFVLAFDRHIDCLFIAVSEDVCEQVLEILDVVEVDVAQIAAAPIGRAIEEIRG